MDEIVEIHGFKVVMETRTCAGKCGYKFKCMKGSSARYARSNCRAVCYDSQMSFIEMKENRIAKVKAIKAKEVKVIDPEKWNRSISLAKECHENDDRMGIADLALGICDRNVRGKNNPYSIRSFAAEIRVDRKTLSRWMKVKETVVNKLDFGLYEPNRYIIVSRMYDALDQNATEELINEEYKRRVRLLSSKGSS